ncbi:hypothetical protein ACQJBY_057573 [Aegilops geniculata]
MASGSSRPQILCVSFNQDNSMFSVGTKEGFKIFDARTGRLCNDNKLGGLNVVELWFATNLIAMVGTGEQDKTFIYDLNSTRILEEIDTVHNPKGLCAFAPNSEWCYLAIPASTSKGSALVYKASEPELICQIDAHESPLAAMAFSSNGMYLATASEKGTMIRVYIVAQATKKRKVTFNSQLLNQTNKLLGSIIPGSKAISDALDPANHHVIHNIAPAETKSCLAVHNVEYSQNSSKFPAVRTVVYVVTHDGYFREYTISTTKSNESSWVLEREFSLLDTGYTPKQNEHHHVD